MRLTVVGKSLGSAQHELPGFASQVRDLIAALTVG